MKCDCVRSQLSNFIDDELGAITELAIEAHLGACDECRAYLAEIKQSREALRFSLNLKASEGFDAAVMEVVTRPRTTFDALIDFMRPGWRQVAASTACAAGIAYLMISVAGVNPSWRNLSQPVLPAQVKSALMESYGYPPSIKSPANDEKEHGEQRSEGIGKWHDVSYS